MPQWFYAKDNQQHGPVSSEELRRLVARGEITPSSLVWCQGMTQWTKLSQVAELNTLDQSYKPLAQAPYSQQSDYTSDQTAASSMAPISSQPNNIFALIGFILGIVSILICCYGLTAIFGLALSVIGRVQISQNPAKYGNKWMATTGIAINSIVLVVYILATVLFEFSGKELEEILRQLESSGLAP